MTLETALIEIKKFWQEDEPFPFGQSDNSYHADRITTEFGMLIPDAVLGYVKSFAPATDFYFDTVGNPMRIYGVDSLKYKQDGYNYNPVKREAISNWIVTLFIFADEGADPVIVDLAEIKSGIRKLMHGAGNWDNGGVIADTFGQFLLCSAAQHHALNSFGEDVIIDDDKGFNLAGNAANWYFKNMKNWAGNYYEEWCSVFDNH